MPQLSKRVGTFTDSVIRRMTRISDEYGAINLSQGFPDFDPPKELMDALAKAAYEGPHQYSVTFGAPNFREALARKVEKTLGRPINPETELCITCGSLSKTYSITGWRLGYLCGPEWVVENAKKVHDFLTVGAPAPLQEAAAIGLDFPDSYYEELGKIYTEKRDYFLAGLDRIGLKHNVPQGTYFVMIDIQDFLKLPQFKGYTDLEFCEWMIKNIGVAAVPGSSFFREPVNNLIRLHFARQKSTLDESINRLAKMAELVKK